MELPSLPFEIVNLPTIEYNYAIQIGSYFVIIMNVFVAVSYDPVLFLPRPDKSFPSSILII